MNRKVPGLACERSDTGYQPKQARDITASRITSFSVSGHFYVYFRVLLVATKCFRVLVIVLTTTDTVF